MKIQSISVPQVCSTRQNGSNFNGYGSNGYAYQYVPQQDSFAKWATKNIITASAFSIAWDLGTNVCARFSKNIDPISVKQMAKNVPTVAGIFMLIGGIFKGVSHLIDNK